MEENLLPYGGELAYHISKLSNAPQLVGGMGAAGIHWQKFWWSGHPLPSVKLAICQEFEVLLEF